MSWRIEWSERALGEVERLARGNPAMARRVGQALSRLAESGRGDLKRLQAGPPDWRLRVGEWRVLLGRDFEDHVITVLRILPRGRAYRD